MNNTELMEDWEVVEKLPKYDDINIFNVEIYGQLRKVMRVGNHSYSGFTPGSLIFIDCTHPCQNILCDESEITAWKIQ